MFAIIKTTEIINILCLNSDNEQSLWAKNTPTADLFKCE